MPPPTSESPTEKEHRGFHLSKESVLSLAESERVDFVPDEVELPRFYGAPVLFAIARDPRTIFTYWSIDWPSIFEQTAPVDRQVHLRVSRTDGGEETRAAAEPMAGNCCLTVSQPRGTYQVEIGFYQPADVWHAVARSGKVTMPPDSVAESTDVDLVTIPFHLSFQRMIDLFRASADDPLTPIISRLQQRALTSDERDALSAEERQILQAMNLALEEIGAAGAGFNRSVNAAALRRRAEALLGFGSTSPAGGFSSSSRT